MLAEAKALAAAKAAEELAQAHGGSVCSASSNRYDCSLSCADGAFTRCGGQKDVTYCGCYHERPDGTFPPPEAGKPDLSLLTWASCGCKGAVLCEAECDQGEVPICDCESRKCACQPVANSPSPILRGPGDG